MEKDLEEETVVKWYVGEDDNKAIDKQPGMEIVCSLDGGLFD
jgi:hypothetical protein